MKATRKDAQKAKGRAAKLFGDLIGDGVAIGITRLGDDQFGLKVNLTKQPAEGVELPDQIEGVPIQIEIVGRIRKR